MDGEVGARVWSSGELGKQQLREDVGVGVVCGSFC